MKSSLIIFLLLLGIFIDSPPDESSKRPLLNKNKLEASVTATTSHVHDPPPYPPCDTADIPHYTAFKVENSINVDGRLDEAEWQAAPRSPRFRDLISGSETIHDTKAAALWDEQFLYVAYWIEEPDLQATLTERDAPIYQNNDVELFIAGRDAYYEFEINSYGTIYEVFFIWEDAYEASGYSKLDDFDRGKARKQPFMGVGYREHPRNPRIAFMTWDFPGLRSAVHLDGTINNSEDRDRGWTVELALPWSGMKPLAMGDGRSLPPKDSDVWQMDFSRFNQYKEALPAKDSGGWVWSPHGVWDSHVPECFTNIHFTEKIVSAADAK